MQRLAVAVVPLANLVPLVRVALIAAVVAPAILLRLAPVLAAALTSGLADIDPIVLTALNLFRDARLNVLHAVTAIALACGANIVFKLAVLAWFNRRLALQVLPPFMAMLAAGTAAWVAQ